MLLVIAEKDPNELDTLLSALESPDREIVVVEDGNNIVTLALKRSPDVVVVGSSIGHMGGFAVARELKMRQDEGTIGEVKVIVLLERSADEWLAGWSRCDAFLTKPVDPLDVDDLVRELTGAAANS